MFSVQRLVVVTPQEVENQKKNIGSTTARIRYMKLTQFFVLTYHPRRRKMFLQIPAYILRCFLQCQFKQVKLWNIVRKMSPKFLWNRFTHDLISWPVQILHNSTTDTTMTAMFQLFFCWEMLCMTLIPFGNCACHSLDVAGHVRDFWWLQVPKIKGKNVTQNNVKYVPSDRLIAKWGWAIELGVSLQSPSHLQGKGGGCSRRNVGGICKEPNAQMVSGVCKQVFFVSRWNKCHEDSIDSTSFLTHPNRRPAKSDLDGLEMISDDDCAVDS